MFRRLSAIEIAEGALLADIGVIFQLLVTYLPIGGDFFRFLIPVVFTIIVLRRGLYVGSMSLTVAAFISGIIAGPGLVILMLIAGMAGLFLGVTMKYRLPDLATLFLGVTSSAFLLYGLIVLIDLLSGIPLSRLVQSIRVGYNALISLTGAITSNIGLGNWWQHSAFPAIYS